VLADLWRWLRDRRLISVRGMTAPAGAGKTRLALALCDEAVAAGWTAGYATESELLAFPRLQNLAVWAWSQPTLIVVDYAAVRALLLRQWLLGSPTTLAAKACRSGCSCSSVTPIPLAGGGRRPLASAAAKARPGVASALGGWWW
jgi:hypothetical protein